MLISNFQSLRYVKMHLETIGVNDLTRIVKNSRQHPLYVGISTDPIERSYNHERTYRGIPVIMHVARTENMKTAEDRLLSKCQTREGCPSNIQRRSNAPEAPGYIYAILHEWDSRNLRHHQRNKQRAATVKKRRWIINVLFEFTDSLEWFTFLDTYLCAIHLLYLLQWCIFYACFAL